MSLINLYSSNVKRKKDELARLKVEGFEDAECNIPELFVKDGLNAKDIYLIKNNELDIKYLK